MLVWEEAYKIGQAEMDSEHLILFSILNQLDINIDNDMAKACVSDVLGALKSYIDYHFAHEEALMRSYDYPRLDEHAAMHRDFVEQVVRLRERLAGAGTDPQHAALKVRSFVLDWLLNHILAADQDYSKFIKSKS